ncbi:MAG: AAA family ATPase [Pelobacteraceae bacterium]
MKIKKIQVKGLFGTFDHIINMNLSAGVTIVIGENGLGKTIILEMLQALFDGKYQFFTNVSFKSFIIYFDDKVKWTVKNNMTDVKNSYVELIQQAGKVINSHKLTGFDDKHVVRMAMSITRDYDYFRRVGTRQWEDRRNGEICDALDIVNRYGHRRHAYYNDSNYSRMHYDHPEMLSLFDSRETVPPEWFFARQKAINVILIKTQRLLALDSPDQKPTNTVEKYSDQISKIIKSKLAESTELSSKLDRTYPNRLIDRLNKTTHVSDEDLNEQLAKLEIKRKLLDEVGLIEIEKDTHLFNFKFANEVVKDVLMLYVKDSFEKLQIFDATAAKIQLFLSIINKRFKHKKLHVDREKGFVLKSTVLKNEKGEYQGIPVNKLSSGEQNELVLFYELIFKAGKNSLILIDEPEISLHISWQNTFIDDLREINRLNSLDILIATHSPDIISNNWDLKVELKGVE